MNIDRDQKRQRPPEGGLNRLEQVTGKKPIGMITKNDVVEFYDLFSQCPQKYRTHLAA